MVAQLRSPGGSAASSSAPIQPPADPPPTDSCQLSTGRVYVTVSSLLLAEPNTPRVRCSNTPHKYFRDRGVALQ